MAKHTRDDYEALNGKSDVLREELERRRERRRELGEALRAAEAAAGEALQALVAGKGTAGALRDARGEASALQEAIEALRWTISGLEHQLKTVEKERLNTGS